MGNITPIEDSRFFSGHGKPRHSTHRLKLACSRMPKHCSPGFSMIELMIVVAIVAILAAIAYPSYTKYIIKTNRSAAEGCLSEYANYMERFYTTNLRYDQTTAGVSLVLPTLDCTSQTASKYSYQFATAQPTATTYTLQAVPVPDSPQAADTQCATLQLDQTGSRTESGTDTVVTDCW